MADLRKGRRVGADVVTVRPVPGQPSRAMVSCGGITVPAALGRSGRSAFKRAGDGATPIASMRFLYGFTRSDRVGSLRRALSLRPAPEAILWCDPPDPATRTKC